MRKKHTLKASIGVNLGIFKFEIERSAQWEDLPNSKTEYLNKPFYYLDEVQPLQNEVRKLTTRPAVWEKELPLLNSLYLNDRNGFRKLIADTDESARTLKLDAGIISLPRKVENLSLKQLSVIDPRTLNLLRSASYGSTKTSSQQERIRAIVFGTGNFERIWVDYNVYENNVKGMKIHLRFTVNNSKDIRCAVAAYFELGFGLKLKDKNQKYHTRDGNVATHKLFTPPYQETVYKDMSLFMPISELHLPKGKFTLRFYARLYKSQTNYTLAESQYVNFTYR